MQGLVLTPGQYTVGIDTPTAEGLVAIDTNFDFYVATGTTNCGDWKKLNP